MIYECDEPTFQEINHSYVLGNVIAFGHLDASESMMRWIALL
jgi:hypothetical protein